MDNQQMQGYQPPVQGGQPVVPPHMTPSGGHHNAGKVLAIVLGVLFLITLVGFIWAFAQYQDYKNNADEKIAVAVEEAEKKKTAELEESFQQERDRLFNKYTTDPGLANVTLEYPRDWSFYLEQDPGSREQINAIFHPTVVREGSPGTYGLRLQLLKRQYSEVVDNYQKSIEDGELLSSPITNGETSGLRLDGQLDRDHNGAVVIFPIRDKTLLIFTDSKEYINVFNEAIGKLSFTP